MLLKRRKATSMFFLEIKADDKNYKKSEFVILPCPYEKTTSYGKGTQKGPEAIIKASKYLEAFDEELAIEPSVAGIYTENPVSISTLYSKTLKTLKNNKRPIILGGEHSLSVEAVRAARKIYPDLSVLCFDAHADLRNKYQGNKQSHACTVRRILEICPVVQVGVRSLSREEFDFAEKSGQIKKIFFHNTVHCKPYTVNPLRYTAHDIKKLISLLSKNIYISFDVDVFDPSVMPSTGTPEPGGFFWNDILVLLQQVCKNKNIVGADFVELMPIKNFNAPDYMIAKLIYKLIGYINLQD